jgi:hypothetical protein
LMISSARAIILKWQFRIAELEAQDKECAERVRRIRRLPFEQGAKRPSRSSKGPGGMGVR